MSEDKKPWFKKVTHRLWWPISWEGWAAYAGFVGALLLLFELNGVHMRENVSLREGWPVLAQVGGLVIGFYWLTWGRTER